MKLKCEEFTTEFLMYYFIMINDIKREDIQCMKNNCGVYTLFYWKN